MGEFQKSIRFYVGKQRIFKYHFVIATIQGLQQIFPAV